MNTIGIIAPNSAIFSVAAKLISELGMEEIVILRMANMESGVTEARELEAAGVGAIVTRGGTGGLIANSNVGVPLVEIPITAHDIVGVISEAKRITGKENPRLAVLAYRHMRYDIEVFSQLTGLEMKIYDFGTSGELLEANIERAIEDGADALLCGTLGQELAYRRGIPGFVLGASETALHSAIQEARRVAVLHRLSETRLHRMRIILDLFPDGVIAVDTEGRIQLANPSAYRLLSIPPEAMSSRIDAFLPTFDVSTCLKKNEASLNEIHRVKNNSLVINARPIRMRNTTTGAVITIQEAGNIREVEAKLRDKYYSKGLTAAHHFDDIGGNSASMRETVRKAKAFAATDGTILITGETGTGKEVFAQSIHNAGVRCNGPFVAVNCAALPPSLLESELFGYEEGAFTGAMRNGKAGYFELAHNGTIFLDEVSEIDPYGQTRLLRVLQEKRTMRLGGGRNIQLDIRIIAASNRNLKELVKRGEFREDLYYRLNALALHLPALRARQGDVRLLAEYFASKSLGQVERESYFTPRALAYLEKQRWPGNIRELQNIVERLCLFYENRPFDLDAVREALHTEAWDGEDDEIPSSSPREQDKDQLERKRILSTLIANGGNQRRAARDLGINPSTLYRKMKLYNIRKTVSQE